MFCSATSSPDKCLILETWRSGESTFHRSGFPWLGKGFFGKTLANYIEFFWSYSRYMYPIRKQRWTPPQKVDRFWGSRTSYFVSPSFRHQVAGDQLPIYWRCCMPVAFREALLRWTQQCWHAWRCHWCTKVWSTSGCSPGQAMVGCESDRWPTHCWCISDTPLHAEVGLNWFMQGMRFPGVWSP